jgi:hypothetical protein
VDGDAQRLDQRAGGRVHPVGQLDDAFGARHRGLGQSAVPGQPEEAAAVAEVVGSLVAVAAVATVQDRVDGDRRPWLDVRNRLADVGDDAGELVSKDERERLARYRVGSILGYQHRPRAVLVEIGATDTTGVDRDPDVGRAEVSLWDVLDTNVFAPVVDGCSHCTRSTRTNGLIFVWFLACRRPRSIGPPTADRPPGGTY